MMLITALGVCESVFHNKLVLAKNWKTAVFVRTGHQKPTCMQFSVV